MPSASDLQALLDTLSKSLTPGAADVFNIVVQRVIVEAAFGVLVGIVIAIAAIIVIGIAIKVEMKQADNSSDAGFALFIGGVTGVIMFVVGIGIIAMNAIDLATPQYKALQTIINEVTGSK